MGAEIAVLIRGDATDRIESVAERIRAAVRLAPMTDERLGLRSLGVSIGMASRRVTFGPGSPDELLRAARMALSEARRAGGDAIVQWGEGEGEPIAIAA